MVVFCPKGRLAEDGVIEPRYQLEETSTKNYPQRTEKNVLASDGTAIFTIASRLTGGSKKTAELAAKHGQPWKPRALGWPSSFVSLGGRKELEHPTPRLNQHGDNRLRQHSQKAAMEVQPQRQPSLDRQWNEISGKVHTLETIATFELHQ
jgi:hypothetical protein